MLTALRRSLITFVGLTAVLAALMAAGGPASAKVPKPAHTYGRAIEAYTAYVPQDSCDPHIKSGTAKLGALLHKTWPDISWSSTRPCDGSVSEHHDGRAIDWMASARNAHTRAEANTLITWLLATDKQGNKFAMARRLGVMYIIFNNRIWGFWSGKWEEYNGCLHKKLAAHSNDNACHRTHVHLSLSWNGARAKTTFWTGHVAATDFGPCVKKGHKYAAKWTRVNTKGCAGAHHG